MELVRLPAQPRAVPWPTESWSRKDANPQKPDDFQRIIDILFNSKSQFGYTYALLIVKEGGPGFAGPPTLFVFLAVVVGRVVGTDFDRPLF